MNTSAAGEGSPSSGPLRTCVGCRTVTGQDELVRLAWDDGDSRVVADPARRLPGRGVYLHPAVSCLELACRRRAIGRALRRPTVDHGEIRARLGTGWENPGRTR